jgi:hypothetical protein
MVWAIVLLLHWHRQVEDARQRLARQLLTVQENERRQHPDLRLEKTMAIRGRYRHVGVPTTFVYRSYNNTGNE